MKIYELVSVNVCHQICHDIFPVVTGQAESTSDCSFDVVVNSVKVSVRFSPGQIIMSSGAQVGIVQYDMEDTHFTIASRIIDQICKNMFGGK